MVYRMLVDWSIPGAGPSATVLHINDGGTSPQGAVTPIRTFFTALQSFLPNEVQVAINPEVHRLNTDTGILMEVLPIVPGAAIAGTSSSAWAAGTGFRVDWFTGVVIGGRQLRGRTFIVPSVGSFGNAGEVNSTTVTAVNTAAGNLISNLSAAGYPLVVWHRPKNSAGGTTRSVTVGSCNALVATLRGRKY